MNTYLFSEIVNVIIKDFDTSREITKLRLHKDILCQCTYFDTLFRLDLNTYPDEPLEIMLSKSEWTSVESVHTFFNCFYSENPSLITKMGLRNCMEIHRLADYFDFERVKKLSRQAIVCKVSTSVDYELLQEYMNCFFVDEKRLARLLNYWMLWKSSKSGMRFFNDFSMFYIEVAGSGFFDTQKRLYIDSIPFVIEFFRDENEGSITVSMRIDTDIPIKYYIEYKLVGFAKDRTVNFNESQWVIGGQFKTQICLIPQHFILRSFVSEKPESLYSIPFLFQFHVKESTFPIDFIQSSVFVHPQVK